MIDDPELDMSPEARTERLYWFLRNLGLVVEPELKEGRWCALRVAVNSTSYPAKKPAKAGIVVPVEGSQVGRTIGTAKDCGLGVINFPSPR